MGLTPPEIQVEGIERQNGGKGLAGIVRFQNNPQIGRSLDLSRQRKNLGEANFLQSFPIIFHLIQ